MDVHSKHVKLHQGSNIILDALKFELNNRNISCIIKNNTESARLAGFIAGDNNNDLFVFEEDFYKAKDILDSFLEKNV
ncbi:MAG: DUF2007 domain-containing protein [Flavobacteriaceae bacterium]